MKTTIDQIIKNAGRSANGDSDHFFKNMKKNSVTVEKIRLEAHTISPLSQRYLQDHKFFEQRFAPRSERTKTPPKPKEKLPEFTEESIETFETIGTPKKNHFISNLPAARLNEFDQFTCVECSYLNTATPYAIEMLEAENIHIHSCRNCLKHHKLIQKH